MRSVKYTLLTAASVPVLYLGWLYTIRLLPIEIGAYLRWDKATAERSIAFSHGLDRCADKGKKANSLEVWEQCVEALKIQYPN